MSEKLNAFHMAMQAFEDKHRDWFEQHGVKITKYYEVVPRSDGYLLLLHPDEDMLPWLPGVIKTEFDRYFSM